MYSRFCTPWLETIPDLIHSHSEGLDFIRETVIGLIADGDDNTLSFDKELFSFLLNHEHAVLDYPGWLVASEDSYMIILEFL
jgi:hypothetical protein